MEIRTPCRPSHGVRAGMPRRSFGNTRPVNLQAMARTSRSSEENPRIDVPARHATTTSIDPKENETGLHDYPL